MADKRSRQSAHKKASCKECFFGCRNLCALGLDEPCPTFRPNDPSGLVPPQQPALLPRDYASAAAGSAAA